MVRLFSTLTNLFAVWVLVGTLWAFFVPAHFTWFKPLIPAALGVVMLGMGVTLKLPDFLEVIRRPVSVLIGVIAQFVIMPSLAYFTARVFQLPTELAVGLILVGCCPGGTASNVIAYLSRANLPLSVLMTMTSTMVAVVLTPLLTAWLAGKYMEHRCACPIERHAGDGAAAGRGWDVAESSSFRSWFAVCRSSRHWFRS